MTQSERSSVRVEAAAGQHNSPCERTDITVADRCFCPLLRGFVPQNRPAELTRSPDD